MLEKITKEELDKVNDEKANLTYCKLLAEKANVEKTNANLILNNLLLKLYVKYKLNLEDTINASGEIIRGKSQTKKEEESDEHETTI